MNEFLKKYEILERIKFGLFATLILSFVCGSTIGIAFAFMYSIPLGFVLLIVCLFIFFGVVAY